MSEPARTNGLDVEGIIRRARRIAHLSQIELAQRIGWPGVRLLGLGRHLFAALVGATARR